MTSPASSARSSDRSPDASAIYSQYLDYYAYINKMIRQVEQIPRTLQNATSLTNSRSQLISLQLQLYPIYAAQYHNSAASLSSFIAACTSFMAQASQIVYQTTGIPAQAAKSNLYTNLILNADKAA